MIYDRATDTTTIQQTLKPKQKAITYVFPIHDNTHTNMCENAAGFN